MKEKKASVYDVPLFGGPSLYSPSDIAAYLVVRAAMKPFYTCLEKLSEELEEEALSVVKKHG